ncbi:MAG: tetratricopeptide repeat protein [Candidatus Heimdallarchaeaceae archaeon]
MNNGGITLFFSGDKEFEIIEGMLCVGDYLQALSLTETKLDEVENEQEKISWIITYCFVLGKLGRYRDALQSAQLAVEKSTKLNDALLLYDSNLSLAEVYRNLGNYEMVNFLIEQLEEKHSVISTLYSRELQLREATLLFLNGWYANFSGKIKKAKNYFIRCLEISGQLGFKHLSSTSLNLLGSVFFKEGDINSALGYFQEWLKLNEECENKFDIAKALNNIGLSYMYQGEYDLALHNLERSLVLKEELGINADMANIRCNMGGVYHERGDLEKALEFYLQCFEIRKEIGNPNTIAAGLCNIGSIYRDMGDFNKAMNYCSQGYEVIKESKDNISISLSLYVLISTCIDRGSINKAKEYLTIFEDISTNSDNLRIKQLFNTVRGRVLFSSNRLKDKFKAQMIFEQIINEKVIRYSITMNAMIYLTELLLFELKTTGESSVLTEVEELTEKLLSLAKVNNSYYLLVQSYLLKSKLSIINFNINQAKAQLIQAQLLAEEKGLLKLAITISNEHDSLLEQFEKWEEYSSKGLSIKERMELVKIESIVNKMDKKGIFDIHELEQEEPILLLILDENGLNLFTKRFLSKSRYDETLLSGFLTAINTFMKETFKSSGHIERIKHQDHTLLIKSQEGLFFCYIFKGRSFFAQNKLSLTLFTLNSKEQLWNSLLSIRKTSKPINEAEFSQISKIVDEIFA